jgi:hypothetical protein
MKPTKKMSKKPGGFRGMPVVPKKMFRAPMRGKNSDNQGPAC